MEEKSVTVWWF